MMKSTLLRAPVYAKSSAKNEGERVRREAKQERLYPTHRHATPYIRVALKPGISHNK